MNTLDRFLTAAALALPLAAFVQTTAVQPTVIPADAPRSQLERDQTQSNGQATQYGSPADTATPKLKRKVKHKAATTGTSAGTNAGSATGSGASNGAAANGPQAGDPSTNGMSSPTTSPSPTTPTSKNSGR